LWSRETVVSFLGEYDSEDCESIQTVRIEPPIKAAMPTALRSNQIELSPTRSLNWDPKSAYDLTIGLFEILTGPSFKLSLNWIRLVI
jgi:hypothetical protein